MEHYVQTLGILQVWGRSGGKFCMAGLWVLSGIDWRIRKVNRNLCLIEHIQEDKTYPFNKERPIGAWFLVLGFAAWLDFWPRNGKFHAQSPKVWQEKVYRATEWWGAKRGFTHTGLALATPQRQHKPRPYQALVVFLPKDISQASIWKVGTEAQGILVTELPDWARTACHRASLDLSGSWHLRSCKECSLHGPGSTQKALCFQMKTKDSTDSALMKK